MTPRNVPCCSGSSAIQAIISRNIAKRWKRCYEKGRPCHWQGRPYVLIIISATGVCSAQVREGFLDILRALTGFEPIDNLVELGWHFLTHFLSHLADHFQVLRTRRNHSPWSPCDSPPISPPEPWSYGGEHSCCRSECR